MHRRTLLTLGLFASAGLVSAALAQPTGGEALFDGRDLDAWTALGDANWRIVDGVAQADTGVGHLVSKETFANFHLRAEVWIDTQANSGVFIRAANPGEVNAQNAYEVNLFDERPDPTYGTGAIVDLAKVDPMPRAAGKWNVLEIRAQGDRFDVWLNGVQTVNGARDAKRASGRISLQRGAGMGVVKFRKVDVRPL